MTERLWTVTGLCEELGVTDGSVGNWRERYDDTPPPAYHVFGGQEKFLQPVWDAAGLKAWRKWYAEHEKRMAHRYRRSRQK